LPIVPYRIQQPPHAPMFAGGAQLPARLPQVFPGGESAAGRPALPRQVRQGETAFRADRVRRSVVLFTLMNIFCFMYRYLLPCQVR